MSKQALPFWALEKAMTLTGYQPHVIEGSRSYSRIELCAMFHDAVVAFADYIAKNEEEPVDPILVEARAVVASLAVYEVSLVLEGGVDSSDEIAAAMAGIRRGIELGAGT